MNAPSREVPIDPEHAALLIIDVQNYCAHPDGAAWRGLDQGKGEYFFRSLHELVLPGLQRVQMACRQAHIEVM